MCVVVVAVRSQDCELVGHFSAMWQELADMSSSYSRGDRSKWTSNFGGSIRFQIPHVDVTGTSFKHYEDAGLSFGQLISCGRLGLQLQECRQAQTAEQARRAQSNALPPVDAIAVPMLTDIDVVHVIFRVVSD